VRKAEALRSESYCASCSIESDAKICWSIQMVDVAKHAARGRSPGAIRGRGLVLKHRKDSGIATT
jgi:hypothetical protein